MQVRNDCDGLIQGFKFHRQSENLKEQRDDYIHSDSPEWKCTHRRRDLWKPIADPEERPPLRTTPESTWEAEQDIGICLQP